MQQDPTTEALSLAIEIPTKTLTSTTQLMQQLFETCQFILLGRRDPEHYGTRTGGLVNVSTRAVNKVTEAAATLKEGGHGGEKSLSYMRGLAARRGETLEVLGAIKEMNTTLDESGFAASCRKYGVNVAIVRGREEGRPTLLVTSSDKSLATAAFFENIEKAVADCIGPEQAEKLEEVAKKVAESRSDESIALDAKVRAGYAELNARLADPDDLSFDKERFISENDLPDLDSVTRTATLDGQSYEFKLKQDPAGRTCWCHDTSDGCVVAANPGGEYMVYHNGLPAFGECEGVDLLTDDGTPWKGRVASMAVSGSDKERVTGVVPCAEAAMCTYLGALKTSQAEGISLDAAFAKVVSDPKGGELREGAAIVAEAATIQTQHGRCKEAHPVHDGHDGVKPSRAKGPRRKAGR